MDHKKVGNYLKELRKERNLTQEQLAEILNVSRRTVSRWETGSNLPDFDVLMELADYYGADLRDILDGERRGGMAAPADEGIKETVQKVADYSSEEKARVTRRMHVLFIAGCVACAVYLISLFCEPEETSAVFDFVQGMSLGITFGMVVVGTIMTSPHMSKIRAAKMRLLKNITK